MPKFTQPPKKSTVQKKTTPASLIKKPEKEHYTASDRLYLHGLNPKERFGCGHVGCSHMGAIEKNVLRHMRSCPMRTPTPASEKES